MICTEEEVFYISLGRRMREERSLKDWTQIDLAKYAEIDPHKVHKYEGGLHRIRSYELQQLAMALDVSADYLIGRDDLKRHRQYSRILESIIEDLIALQNPRLLQSVHYFVRTLKTGFQRDGQTASKLCVNNK